MRELAPRTRTILEVVASGRGVLSTRSIDIRVSQQHAPAACTLLDELRALQAEGYVCRMVSPGSPNDAWTLTDAGRSLLDGAPSA
jgi:DNA-binding HxlR family transcriptional regulator